jgi:integrase
MKLKKNIRTGHYCVLVPVPSEGARKKHKWISVGATSRARAEAIISEASVDRLILLAQAQALTADAISVVTTGRRFTCDDILTAWEQDAFMSLSAVTIDSYKTSITTLFDRVGCRRHPLPALKRNHLDSYINEEGTKASTRHGRLAALRSFWGFAQNNAYVTGNIAETVRVRRKDMTHKQQEKEGAIPLTEDEYRILITSPKVSKFWRRAIILGYWVGLRIGDVARLDVASLGDDSIKVWTHKRSKRIELPLSDPLIGSHELRQVVAELRAETKEGYCFPDQQAIIDSKQRNLLSMQAIRLMEAHGVDFKSFHSLRSSCAQRWDAAGKTLLEIGKLLAHSPNSPETTEGYINS